MGAGVRVNMADNKGGGIMDKETYIRAVLETNFAGFKKEIIEIAVKKIMEYADEVGRMRLIDADAIMSEFAEFVRASNNSDLANVPTWNDAVSLVGSAPTIEAEPKKHGRWSKDVYGYALCSVCGGMARTDGQKLHYCPWCGAKMDEVENDKNTKRC